MLIKNCDYISLLGDLFEIFTIHRKDIKLLGNKFSLPGTKLHIHCDFFSSCKNNPG